MTKFKKFSKFEGENIKFKIWFNRDQDFLELVLSYSDKDIFGGGEYHDFDDRRVYYKKFSIHRDEWAAKGGVSDYSQVFKAFEEAEQEFEKNEERSSYKEEINLYLIKKAEEFIKTKIVQI